MLQQPNLPDTAPATESDEDWRLTDWLQTIHSTKFKVDNDAAASGFEVLLEGGMERFKCTYPGCGKMYRRRCRVQEHIGLQHNPDGVVRFGCKEEGCAKSYCRLDALKAHQRQESHTGINRIYQQAKSHSPRPPPAVFLITHTPYPQSSSPSPTNSPSPDSPPDSPRAVKDPASHKVIKVCTATSVRYKCCVTECGKSYATRFRCEVHMEAKHTEGYEKPFVCAFPGCTKAYSTKDSLTRHKRGATHFVEGESDKRMEGEDPMKQPRVEEVSREKRDKMQELVDLFDEV